MTSEIIDLNCTRPQDSTSNDGETVADKIAKNDVELQKVIAKLNEMNLSECERAHLDSRYKGLMDYGSRLHDSIREGEMDILLRFCIEKYGQYPDLLVSKLYEARSEDLYKWGRQLLKSETLNDWLLACGLSKN